MVDFQCELLARSSVIDIFCPASFRSATAQLLCVPPNREGRFYKFAMQEVRRTQDFIHAKLAQDVQGIEIAVKAMLAADSHGSADKAIVGVLTDFVHARGNYIVSEWQALFPRLVSV